MKHLIILFCYKNLEDIVESYNSMKCDGVDFFVVENRSDRSKEISQFFETQKLIGYIQFNENITNNALKIFFNHYHDLITQYEYITLSDCDIVVDDIDSTLAEIRKNLELPGVAVSCVDLTMSNLPLHIPGADTWIPNPKLITPDYIECRTGLHLMTVKNENLSVYYNVNNIVDSTMADFVEYYGMKWVKTLLNKAYHLTWDRYVTDHEYYEFKVKTKNLWNHNSISDYTVIV